MARKGKSKDRGSKKSSKSSKGSRQKDREQEKVDFETVFDPIIVEREGTSNFIQVVRTEITGRDTGKTSEFLQIKPGFYTEDDDEPHFQRKCKECDKAPGVTFSPAMLGEVVDALMDMATDEEAEEFGFDEEEDDEEDE